MTVAHGEISVKEEWLVNVSQCKVPILCVSLQSAGICANNNLANGNTDT